MSIVSVNGPQPFNVNELSSYLQVETVEFENKFDTEEVRLVISLQKSSILRTFKFDARTIYVIWEYSTRIYCTGIKK